MRFRFKPLPASRNQALIALICFALSTVITWLFIKKSVLYTDEKQEILSCAIAGGKWGLQIIMALFILGEKKWLFIKNISVTCLVGAIILAPYLLFSPIVDADRLFFYLLISSVVVMIFGYYKSVQQSGVSPLWYWGWLASLALAICLQFTVVFGVW